MFGLMFENRAAVVASDPNRMDIACFVGFVARRPGSAVPREVLRWLDEQGWGSARRDVSPEVIAVTPLPDTIALTPAQATLRLTMDGETQEVALPVSSLSRTDFVLALTHRIRGGYARLSGTLDAGTANRLVLGSDYSGPASTITVAPHLALGFPSAATGIGGSTPADLEGLLDVPVPIDSWEVFDRLFLWDERPVSGSNEAAATYLGAAVRSFFAQGGRKCYVVRAGDPWPLQTGRVARAAYLPRLLPGFPYDLDASPTDRSSWRGIAHILGLRDASFLCLPDLPEAVSADLPPIEVPEAPPPPPEEFVECSDELTIPPDLTLRGVPVPRCDEAGYADWSRALGMAGQLLAHWNREVQLLAAVPLPLAGSHAEPDLLAFLADDGRGPLANPLYRQLDGIASAFIQLAYPWLRTPTAQRMPGQVESPEGVLAGMLAQTALTRGAYRSSAGWSPLEVSDVYPILRRDEMLRPRRDSRAPGTASHNLLQRVSLFGPVPGGIALLSDVTTSLQESYRPASVNRLVSSVVRAARRSGEDLVFEASNERLWARIITSLTAMLLGLLRDGALVGTTPDEAFSVRCDRTTMTRNDIDNGRVICRIELNAAAAIETITVVLALEEGGGVSLVSARGALQEAG